jgi:hypothetical protein
MQRDPVVEKALNRKLEQVQKELRDVLTDAADGVLRKHSCSTRELCPTRNSPAVIGQTIAGLTLWACGCRAAHPKYEAATTMIQEPIETRLALILADLLSISNEG